MKGSDKMQLDEILKEQEFYNAYLKLGEEEFIKHYRQIFGTNCLDFVKTIVINLPESCYANCDYCIDKYLRRNSIETIKFLNICEKVLREFPTVLSVSITGGTLKANDFNNLTSLIKEILPLSRISFNTNGVGFNEEYLPGINNINRINLHRNAVDDLENAKIFKTDKHLLTIEEAKALFGDKLYIRVTIDEQFNLESYASLGIPLYLNRLLPGTPLSIKTYYDTLNKIEISEDIDQRRRNVYLSAMYKDIPIRICVGDEFATHISGRKPTNLNVAIVHRSGIVCGSWYEDDKVIFNPYEHEKSNKKLTLKK